jgi:predicted HicB family RNase H-like nuclease
MNNVMKIGGYQAVIAFDPEISMFRGEFPGRTFRTLRTWFRANFSGYFFAKCSAGTPRREST